MSQSNPDTRPLPPGWITQYDVNYKAWYYVNTQENPPRSVWVHPLGPPPPPPSQYTPPPGPPPPTGGYNQGPQFGGAGYGGPPQGGWGGQGQGQGYQPQQQMAPYPPQDGGHRGWFGGGSKPPPPPTQVVYTQAPPPKKSGIGMGTAIAAGGAALLGGAFLEHEWKEHNEEEREIGYDQGFDQATADFDSSNNNDFW